MFCKIYRQPAGALWLSLYCIKCKRHVIALLYHYALAIVVEAIVGETTTMLRWRSRCQASDDGDHDNALEIEIKAQDDDGHIMSHILISCDVYPLCILFFLVRVGCGVPANP